MLFIGRGVLKLELCGERYFYVGNLVGEDDFRVVWNCLVGSKISGIVCRLFVYLFTCLFVYLRLVSVCFFLDVLLGIEVK